MQQEDEVKALATLAEKIKVESCDLKDSSPNDDVLSGGCCYITLRNGKRECFDWDGLGYNDCKKIGEQAGLPWQFLPGQKCML